ncbi:MAG TPA: hypothetical protein VI685_07675 [Candidatus Angelobacter sp.]
MKQDQRQEIFYYEGKPFERILQKQNHWPLTRGSGSKPTCPQKLALGKTSGCLLLWSINLRKGLFAATAATIPLTPLSSAKTW